MLNYLTNKKKNTSPIVLSVNYSSVTEMYFRVLVAFEVISIVNFINYSYLKDYSWTLTCVHTSVASALSSNSRKKSHHL